VVFGSRTSAPRKVGAADVRSARRPTLLPGSVSPERRPQSAGHPGRQPLITDIEKFGSGDKQTATPMRPSTRGRSKT